MLSQEQVGLLHDLRLAAKGLSRRSAGRVGLRVRRLLRDEADANQHAQAVRLRREQGVAATEEQDPLGARLADAGKAPQCLPRLCQRLAHGPVEVATELLAGDARAFPELGREGVLEDAMRGDPLESLPTGCQDGVGSHTDGRPELLEGLAPLFRRGEVGHVLQQDELEGVARGRPGGSSVVRAQPLDDLR